MSLDNPKSIEHANFRDQHSTHGLTPNRLKSGIPDDKTVRTVFAIGKAH